LSKKKADIFMQHYASVSKLNFSKEERDTNSDSAPRQTPHLPPNS
jgi:hypothetical protein